MIIRLTNKDRLFNFGVRFPVGEEFCKVSQPTTMEVEDVSLTSDPVQLVLAFAFGNVLC